MKIKKNNRYYLFFEIMAEIIAKNKWRGVQKIIKNKHKY